MIWRARSMFSTSLNVADASLISAARSTHAIARNGWAKDLDRAMPLVEGLFVINIHVGLIVCVEILYRDDVVNDLGRLFP